MNAVPPPPTRRQTTKQLRTALQQPTGKNLANVHRVRCMQTHQKLPEKVKAEVARNTLKQGEISPRMIAVEGRRDKLFETLTRLAEHLEMGYAKASTTLSGGGGGGEATSPGGTGGGPAEWRGWEVEEAEAGTDDTQISSLRRSIAAQVLWLQEERMRLLGLADLRPAGATGRRVEASCRQAAQQARNAQSSFAMQPKAVVLKIDQLLSDVHTVSQVLIPHRIRYSTHTHIFHLLLSPFLHHSLPPPLPSSTPRALIFPTLLYRSFPSLHRLSALYAHGFTTWVSCRSGVRIARG